MEYSELLTVQDQDDSLLQGVLSHERQHFGFDQQAKVQEAVLAQLPKGDWPEHLVELRKAAGGTKSKLPGRDKIIKHAKSQEDREQALLYLMRDHLFVMAEAAKFERRKNELLHAAALSALPAERRAAALQRAKAKREAEQARR